LILTASSGPLAASDDEAVEIPDKDPGGVVRSLDLPSGHTIGEIAVSVDITHPWVGDLQVTLTHPDGTSVRLHDRAGGSRDNLVETWHSRDVPGLRALLGLDTGGAWQLQVADMASRDVGKLNRWQIEITE
jgi:subtilisin-like proprotein convertase family protein